MSHYKDTCLYPECDRPTRSRGLCASHYTAIRYHVRLGRYTWEELELKGKARPKRFGRYSGAIEKWLES